MIRRVFISWATVATVSLCAANALAQELEKVPAISCKGGENVKIENKHVEGSGFAVKATGRCTITILKSTLEASNGIIVEDDAEVILEDVKIRAGLHAIDLRDNSKISLSQVSTQGDILVASNATFVKDRASSRLEAKNETAGVKADAELVESEPIRCVGKRKLVIENTLIRTKGDGISIMGECKVTIRNSRIISEDDAIVARGKGSLRIVDSEIIAKDDALRLVGRIDVILKGSRIVGKIKRIGQNSIVGLGGNQLE